MINRKYDQEYLNNLISYVRTLDCLNEKDIVYIGGSIVEGVINKTSFGMGNSKSDVDVFIIREYEEFIKTNGEYTEDVCKTIFRNFDRIGYDIEIYDKNKIQLLIDAMKNCQLDQHKRVSNAINTNNIWDFYRMKTFLTRLQYSCCVKGEESYYHLKRDINLEVFFEINGQYIINEIDNVMEDVLGNIENKIFDTAVYCIRKTYLLFLEYILNYEKELVDREKWIILKFKNLSILKDEYSEMNKNYKNIFLEELTENDKSWDMIRQISGYIKEQIEELLLEAL